MNPKLMCGLVAVLLVTSTASAQRVPDFSGIWRMDRAHSESTAQSVPVPADPATVVIAQTASAVRVETRWGGITKVQSFRLNPVDNPRPVGTSGTTDAEVSWDGDTLVTMSVETENNVAMRRTVRRTLDPNGTTMTVETTLSVPHASAASTSKDVYRKVSQ